MHESHPTSESQLNCKLAHHHEVERCGDGKRMKNEKIGDRTDWGCVNAVCGDFSIEIYDEEIDPVCHFYDNHCDSLLNLSNNRFDRIYRDGRTLVDLVALLHAVHGLC